MDVFENEDPLEMEIEIEVVSVNEEPIESESELKNNKDAASVVPNPSDSKRSSEASKIVKDETKIIAAMYSDNPSDFRSCCNLYNCNKLIPKKVALQHRQAFQKMSKEHQDIIIMSYLQAHRRLPTLNYDENKKYKKKHTNTSCSRKRNDIRYFFCDIPICKKMYLFLHDVGTDRYESICKHYDKNGIIPRVHKLKNVKPTRQSVLNEADIESVVSFVKLYGDQYGSKVKRSKIKGQHVIKLPLGETKSSIYRKYCETFEFGDVKKVARTTFIGIWKKHCPYITVTHVLDNACFKE